MGPSDNVYIDALEEAGRSLGDVKLVSGPIGIHLAETTERAWDEAEEALHAWVTFYVKRGSPVGRGLPPVGELRTQNFPFGGMPFMVGSLDEVRDQMRATFDTAPLDEMVLYFHPRGMSHRCRPPGDDVVRAGDHAGGTGLGRHVAAGRGCRATALRALRALTRGRRL